MSTTLSTVTCVPHQGAGLVARLGGDLFLVVGGSPDSQAYLLRVCSEVVARGGDGRSLVRALAGQVTTQGDQMPACAALAPSGNNLVVFLHGEAQADSGELFKLSGRESVAWVDRVVPWPLDSVTISLAGAEEVAEGAYNLRDGAVPGAGLTLTSVDEGSDTAPDVPVVPPSADVVLPPQPSSSTTHAAEQAATGAHAAPGQQPSAGDARSEAAVAPFSMPAPASEATPAPSGRQPAGEVEGSSAVVIDFPEQPEDQVADAEPEAEHTPGEHTSPHIPGVHCENDHFNDPRQLSCRVCGIDIVQETAAVTSGPRPSLGALVLDDGSVFPLDEEYVIGREPTVDESVAGGHRRALHVDDDHKTVSRAHARIEMHDWDVVLFDDGSANGTFVAAEGETTWQHVPADQPYVLRPGARILIGRRTMFYDPRRAG